MRCFSYKQHLVDVFRNLFHNVLSSEFRPFVCIVINIFELNFIISFHIFLLSCFFLLCFIPIYFLFVSWIFCQILFHSSPLSFSYPPTQQTVTEIVYFYCFNNYPFTFNEIILNTSYTFHYISFNSKFHMLTFPLNNPLTWSIQQLCYVLLLFGISVFYFYSLKKTPKLDVIVTILYWQFLFRFTYIFIIVPQSGDKNSLAL